MKKFISEVMIVLIVAMIGTIIMNIIEVYFFYPEMPVKLEALMIVTTAFVARIIVNKYNN